MAIIGSSGFIGRNLYTEAASLGHEVFRIDHDVMTGGDAIFCDLANGIEPKLPENLDAVFYLAQSPYYRRFPEHTHNLFTINSQGPVIAAKAALDSGCKFFCYASSGNVYAPSFSPLAEISPVAPSSPYAASKLMGETGLTCFKNTMCVVCCRIFGAYGPGQTAMLPWMLLKKIINSEPVLLEPRYDIHDGGLKVSFIYIGDLVARLLCLMKLGCEGASLPFHLNLAGPRPISIEEFANLIAEKTGRRSIFEIGEKPREFNLWGDITLLNSLCPFLFTTLEDGVGRMVDAALKDNR